MRHKAVHRRLHIPLLFFSLFVLLCLLNPVLAQDTSHTVQAGLTSDGIPTLMDAKGMTLYTFAPDKGGASTCYNQCAQAWPPLTVGTGAQPNGGTGVSGILGTTQRTDGTLQVTYNGWPLYNFAQDTASGDAKGQGIRDIWFTASPALVMVSNIPGFGNILVGPGGLTLYIFLNDEVKDGQGSTYCTKECQATWPPLLVPAGVDPSAGADVPGTLGVSDRNDGSHQVTYNGYPLYYFKQDEKPGDTKGNKAKDVWYVATPEEAYAEQPQVNTQLVAQGLSAPVVLTSARDNTGRLFIADQAGTIRILTKDGTLLDQPFLDLTGQILPLNPNYDERGLLGLAFHPDYANNGRFFVYYSVPLSSSAPAGWDHTNVVAEVDVSKDDPNKADLSTLRVILSVDQPQLNHNAGQIAFGPDGDLYIPIGDGGGGDDKDLGHTPGIGNGQDNSDLHGNILRIDVNGAPPYAIPPDNPFVNVANTRPEIYAYGLRNPFHISFDSSGRLFAGDAGQELFEEVDIIQAGGNYGWHIREGNHCFDPQDTTVPPASCATTGASGEPLINPILEFDHSKGVTVIGGYVYEGSALSDLAGDYIFGTYSLTDEPPNGLVFAASMTSQISMSIFRQRSLSSLTKAMFTQR